MSLLHESLDKYDQEIDNFVNTFVEYKAGLISYREFKDRLNIVEDNRNPPMPLPLQEEIVRVLKSVEHALNERPQQQRSSSDVQSKLAYSDEGEQEQEVVFDTSPPTHRRNPTFDADQELVKGKEQLDEFDDMMAGYNAELEKMLSENP